MTGKTDPDAKTKFQQVHAAYKRITDPKSFEDEDAFTDEAVRGPQRVLPFSSCVHIKSSCAQIFAMFEEMLRGVFSMAGPLDSEDEDLRVEYGVDEVEEYEPIDGLDPAFAHFLLHVYDYADPLANRSIAEVTVLRQLNCHHPA
jgi:hypothetical protein